MKKALLSILLLFAFVSGAYSQFSPPAQGLAFGNGSYVKVPDNSSLQFGAGDFTIETWTKKNSSSSSFSNSGVVMKWNTGVRPGTNEWALNNTAGGSDDLPAFIMESGTTMYTVSSGTALTQGVWYHLAVVRRGGVLTLYVNGNQVGFTNIPPNAAVNNIGSPMYLAAYRFNSAGEAPITSNINMDELRIWKRALCVSELNSGRNCEMSLPQAGLSALYHFNQGLQNANNANETVLFDATSNANNGTLLNFALNGSASNWSNGIVQNTCQVSNSPEIQVKGNGNIILTGDNSPSGADNTDMGQVPTNQDLTKNFTIENTGTAPLTINSINFTGVNPGNFSVQGVTFPVSVNANSSFDFTVRFFSNFSVTANANMNINNTDCDESLYTFAVTARTSCVPPSFVNTNPNVQGVTNSVSCSGNVAYPLGFNGVASVTYIFTGATTGSGNGTGAGQMFNKGVTHVQVTASNACGTVNNFFDVTVNDIARPIARVKNATVYLDANGRGTLNAEEFNNGSSDNCGPVTVTFPNSTICATTDEGGTLTLTAPAGEVITGIKFASYGTPNGTCGNFTFGSCNSTSSRQVVEQMALGKNSVTISATNAVFGDPCPNTFKRLYVEVYYGKLTTAEVDCSNVGTKNVTIAVTDASGNVSITNALLTILDTVKPTVTTQNITLSLNADGKVNLSPSAIVTSSFDACGVQNISLSKFSFDCSNKGDNIVTVTVIDRNNNIQTAEAVVTIIDNTAPVASAKDITIVLNADGSKEISAEDINNNSFDACGMQLSISKKIFTCNDAGHWNEVVLTVTDASGNVSTATANITVIDNTAPIAKAKNKTVYLDAAGNAQLTAEEVNDGSSDACDFSLSIDKTTFSCANVGTVNPVLLTVTDASGNVSTATAYVTVLDNIPPIVKAKNITVALVNGTAVINASAVDAGSEDACGVTLSIDKTTFDCTNIGNNAVTLTATDASGNKSTAQATVTVTGTVPVITTSITKIDYMPTGLAENSIALGYGAQSLTLNAVATDAVSYVWSPASVLTNANTANARFAPATAGVYTFTVTVVSASGCVSEKTLSISVTDVRCGNKGDKTVVCHTPPGNTANPQTICIANDAVAAHLAKESVLGACPITRTTARKAEAPVPPAVSKSSNKEELTVNDGTFNITATPNPTSGLFTARLNNAAKGKARVEVIGLSGNVVDVKNAEVSNGVTTITFDLSGKAQGMYKVRAVTSDGKQTVTTVFIRR